MVSSLVTELAIQHHDLPNAAVISKHSIQLISHFDKAMCWGTVLSPPKTSKHSLPMLIIKMLIDRQLRLHFLRKSKGQKSSRSYKVLPKTVRCSRELLLSKLNADGCPLGAYSCTFCVLTLPFITNDASSPIMKSFKQFSCRQCSLSQTEKRNRRANNSCRTYIRYGCHFMSCFVIRLKLEWEIGTGL